MKTIFKKANLPFVERVINEGASGRDHWTLARCMQEEQSFSNQVSTELLLLQRGAYAADLWSMCELARTYFNHGGDICLPHALMWWKKAALFRDPGAIRDISSLPIRDRILAWKSGTGHYTTLEMRCAMLAEWHLSQLGVLDYRRLSDSEILLNVRALVKDVAPLLLLPPVTVEAVPNMHHNSTLVDGLSYWEHKVQYRTEMARDQKRLIQVIFHELGHQIQNEIHRGTPDSVNMRLLYGLSEKRIASWRSGVMGYEVPTQEEDPDTLSYGVYTNWALFFANK